jgi:RND family efflux transporter MFP subunit
VALPEKGQRVADTSESIHQLRIDRTAPPSAGRGRTWLVAVAGIIIAGLLVWLLSERLGNTVRVETDVARKPPSVAAASSVLDASGYVVARRQATISSKVTGKVLEVLVEEGMRVEKDQIVARLDDTTQQAQLTVAAAQVDSARAALAEISAQLRNARQERDRQRELAAKGLTSQASLDNAEAVFDELAARLETGRENVHVAESNVLLARDALSNMTIRAPFAGMVVTKNAQPGEMISPISAGGGFTRTGICTIIDNDSLEIEVDVNEAYIQRVVPGQRVSAVLDAYPDWQVSAEVIAIIPTADRQKATVRVRIGFLERDARILRDMGVKVSFLGDEVPAVEMREVEGVLVPGAALRSDENGDFVWIVRDGVVERRSVQLGGSRDRPQVLVRSGIVAGDTVVRVSEKPLSSGQAVSIN